MIMINQTLPRKMFYEAESSDEWLFTCLVTETKFYDVKIKRTRFQHPTNLQNRFYTFRLRRLILNICLKFLIPWLGNAIMTIIIFSWKERWKNKIIILVHKTYYLYSMYILTCHIATKWNANQFYSLSYSAFPLWYSRLFLTS